jgi:MoaA/NifB/PqqE/SkfB family radical SAM enzyme
MMKDSNILNYVLLEVTDKCNLACRHCRVENLNCVSNPLTKEEIFKIIKTSSKLGAKVITFSGGEPLLRSDITALVDCASKNGLKPRIQSNGYLINKKIIQDLKNAGLKTLGIGLDGSKSEIHNWLRRNNKAFNKTLNAIKLTREAGIDVHVESTITKFNQADVENIIDLAEKVGASTFLTRCVIAVGKANTNLMVSKKENKDLLNRIMKKKYKMNLLALKGEVSFNQRK